MLKKQFKNGWTQVPNAVINHTGLSFKAKGLWMYINSKPENWDFAIWRIVKETREGEKSIRAGLQELVKLGYLQYKAKYVEGRLAGQLYILLDEPDTQNTLKQEPLKAEAPKISTTQNGGFNNNTYLSKKDLSKKEVEPANQKIEKLKSLIGKYQPTLIDHPLERKIYNAATTAKVDDSDFEEFVTFVLTKKTISQICKFSFWNYYVDDYLAEKLETETKQRKQDEVVEQRLDMNYYLAD